MSHSPYFKWHCVCNIFLVFDGMTCRRYLTLYYLSSWSFKSYINIYKGDELPEPKTMLQVTQGSLVDDWQNECQMTIQRTGWSNYDFTNTSSAFKFDNDLYSYLNANWLDLLHFLNCQLFDFDQVMPISTKIEWAWAMTFWDFSKCPYSPQHTWWPLFQWCLHWPQTTTG